MNMPGVKIEREYRGIIQRVKIGISLKWLTLPLVVLVLTSAFFSIVHIWRFNKEVSKLASLTNERQLCDDAISGFMMGSDYLTTQIWFYVTTHDSKYMRDYWREVEIAQSRDIWIDRLHKLDLSREYIYYAEKAKAESDALINLELWAMRMIAESENLTESEMPGRVATYQLSQSDRDLSAVEKAKKSIEYIYGAPYRDSKQQIITNVDEFKYNLFREFTNQSFSLSQKINTTAGLANFGLILLMIAFSILVIVIYLFVDNPLNANLKYLIQVSAKDKDSKIPDMPLASKEIKKIAQLTNNIIDGLREKNAILQKMNETDYLTQMPNERKAKDFIDKYLKTAKEPLGIMVLNIDMFKKINELFGRAEGDRALQEMGQILTSMMYHYNKFGLAGRLNNDEFIMILPNNANDKVDVFAQIILKRVRAYSASQNGKNAQTIDFTVSIGSVVWNGNDLTNVEQLISKADQALGIAKKRGGDVHISFGREMSC